MKRRRFPSAAAKAFLALLCALALGGCASFRKAFPPKPKPAPPAPARPARPGPGAEAAQKKAYDEGMRHFSEERYQEARASWRKALQMDPDSATGRKCREHLRKVDTILESLKDIKAQ